MTPAAHSPLAAHTPQATLAPQAALAPLARLSPHTDLSGLGSRGARAVFLTVWLFIVMYAVVGEVDIAHPPALIAALAFLGASALTTSAPAVDSVFPLGAALATALAPVLAIAAFAWSVAGVLPQGRLWLLQVGGLFASLLPVRGRVLLGWLSLGAQAGALAIVGAMHYDVGRTLAQLVVPAAGVCIALYWRAMLRRSVYFHDRAVALTERTRLEHQARLEAATVALSRLTSIHAMTDGILAEIIESQGNIAAGTRERGARQGWAVRDVLRAPGLDIPEVSDAVARARDRGVQVRLLDDDPLTTPIHASLVARVVEILEAVATGTVTVRIVPPGRPCLITVVVDDGETSSRIELPEAVDAQPGGRTPSSTARR